MALPTAGTRGIQSAATSPMAENAARRPLVYHSGPSQFPSRMPMPGTTDPITTVPPTMAMIEKSASSPFA